MRNKNIVWGENTLKDTLIAVAIGLACFAATGLAHSCAQGQEPQTYERYRLPEGRRVVVEGETYQAFNLQEYRELLHMDADLRYYVDANMLLGLRIDSLNLEITALEDQVSALNEQVEILSLERTRLREMWATENRLRFEAEAGSWTDWLGWAFGGVFLVSTVTMIVALALQ